MMTIPQIAQYLISNYFNRRIPLDDKFFTGLGMENFLPQYIGSDTTLIFSNTLQYLPKTSKTQLAYTGSISFLNCAFLEAQMIITAEEGGLRFMLLFPLPSDWQFSDSFSELPGSYNYSTGLPTLQRNFLNEMTLKDSCFILSSGAYADDDGVVAQAGISFSSTLMLLGPFVDVGNLTGKTQVRINGPIVLETNPCVSLSADIPYTGTFAGITVQDVSISLYSSLKYDPTLPLPNYSGDEYFDISGRVKFGKYILDIQTPLVLGGADIIALTGLFEPDAQPKLPSLADIADLAGGKDLENLLPSALQNDSGLSLSELDLCIRPSTKTVLFAGFRLSSNKNWDLIPGKVNLGNIQLSFLINSPFDTKYRQLSVGLSGDVKLGETGPSFTVGGSYPDWMMFCALTPGSSVNLKDIFDHFGVPLSDIGIKDMTCTELDITVVPSSGYFKFYGDVQSDWEIPIGSQKFTISDLTFEYDRSGDTPFIAVTGAFKLNTTGLIISAARYPGDSGWTFTGETAGGSIDLTALGTELAGILGCPIPTQLPAISVKNMFLQFNTAASAFAFSCETDLSVTLSLGSKQYTLNEQVLANLNSYIDPTSNTRVYTGNMQALLKVGSCDFIVEYAFGNTSQFKASWASTDGTTVGIDDFLDLLGISSVVSIPKGLDLALTQVNFAYDATASLFTLSASSKNYGDAFITAGKDNTGSWALVFGVNFPPGSKLSSLPVIGSVFGPLDSISFTQSSIIVCTGTFNNYSIPILPQLNADTGLAAIMSNSGRRNVSPVGKGQTMQLTAGVTLAAVMDLAGSTSNVLMSNMRTVLGKDQVQVQVSFGPGDIKVFAGLSDVGIHIGNETLQFSNTGILVEYTGGQLIVQVKGDISFTIEETKIDATVRLAIDETEAIGAVSISSDHSSLPSPPGIKGLHLQQFGIELGLYFEPAGVIFGLQGKFKVGDQVADDQFCIILEIIEEVPNLLFLSFYFQSLDLGQIITVFTDQAAPPIMDTLQIIKLSNTSFYFAENTQMLPDGTIAQPGFAFSTDLEMLSFKAHGDFKIDASSGVQGLAELDPLNLYDVLKITGDGEGIVRNYIEKDGQQVPLKNSDPLPPNVPVTLTQIVSPGGAILRFNSTTSPYLHLDIEVTLLGIEKEKITAEIDKTGITFSLSYDLAGIEHFDMQCTLKNWDNFSSHADMKFGVDEHIGPIHVLGINCGSIHLQADIHAGAGIKISPSDFGLSLGIGCDFMGIPLNIPDLDLSVAPSSLAEVPKEVIDQIKKYAEDIFKDFFSSAEEWAKWVGKKIIEGFEEIGKVLKEAFKLIAEEAAKIMKGLEMAAEDVAKAMKEVGYALEEVAGALKNVFDIAAKDVAAAMKVAGYIAEEVAKGLQQAYAMAAQDAATALKAVGYAADEVAKGLESVYGMAAKDAAVVLNAVGYAADEVAKGLESVYGLAAKDAAVVLSAVGYAADEVAKGLKSIYGMTADEAAKVLSAVGYGINEIGGALSGVFGATKEGIAEALKGAGYAVDKVGDYLKDTYDLGAEALGDVLKGAGYAIDDIKDFFNSLGGDFKKAVEAMDPTKW